MKYAEEKVPLVVLAGKEYGTGSSRDWAAKGTKLLGVRAVIAKSFERIHRSNLVGMGVLPLEFAAGEGAETLGLTGRETFDIGGVAHDLAPGKKLQVVATGGGRLHEDLHRHLPHRYAERGRLLPARRHPAVRAAADPRRQVADRRAGGPPSHPRGVTGRPNDSRTKSRKATSFFGMWRPAG